MKHQAPSTRQLAGLETSRERASQLLIIRDITEAREREQCAGTLPPTLPMS